MYVDIVISNIFYLNKHFFFFFFFSFMFILYTSEMLELVENRLYAYADDFTLLVVVPKTTDGPAGAASLCREFARNQ